MERISSLFIGKIARQKARFVQPKSNRVWIIYYCVRIFFYREEKKFNRAETDHSFAIIFFLLAIKKILFAENSSILAKIFLMPTFPGFMSTLNILK